MGERRRGGKDGKREGGRKEKAAQTRALWVAWNAQ